MSAIASKIDLSLAAMVLILLMSTNGFAFQDKSRSEKFFSNKTKAWISIPDPAGLKKSVDQSQFGQLLKDPVLKPWMEDLEKQAVEWLNKNNVRLGFDFEDLDSIKAGEISVGAVLLDDKSYSIVVIVDISEAKEDTVALLEKIGKRLEEQEAEKTVEKIHDVNVNSWKFPAPKGFRERQRFAFNAIAGDWLIMTDQKKSCRELIRKIVLPDAADAESLAMDESFKKIQQRLEPNAKKHNAQVRWFIEPWGYIKISQLIIDEQHQIRQLRNNKSRIFQEEGFDAIKALGGWLAVKTKDHELVHQTFIYAPSTVEGAARYRKAAGILDFENTESNPLAPQDWMSPSASSVTSLNWNLNKVLEHVGSLFDSMAGSPGSTQNTIDALESQYKLELTVKELVASLGKRINIISDIQEPIDERSERILISIEVKKNLAIIAKAIEAFIGESGVDIEEYKEHRIIVIDLTKDKVDPGADVTGPVIPDDPLFPSETPKEEPKGLKPLFEKRVICVAMGHVFISNNVDYMKRLLDNASSKPGEELTKANDYQRVHRALVELDPKVPSFYNFGRIDRSVRVNYEMMRQGKMDSSQTMLAQLLEQLIPKNEDALSARPKIDVSKMPADFEKSVGKYLGVAGWKLMTEKDGWSIVGCILQRDDPSKTEDTVNKTENKKAAGGTTTGQIEITAKKAKRSTPVIKSSEDKTKSKKQNESKEKDQAESKKSEKGKTEKGISTVKLD